jgi:hypothetical protein
MLKFEVMLQTMPYLTKEQPKLKSARMAPPPASPKPDLTDFPSSGFSAEWLLSKKDYAIIC